MQSVSPTELCCESTRSARCILGLQYLSVSHSVCLYAPLPYLTQFFFLQGSTLLWLRSLALAACGEAAKRGCPNRKNPDRRRIHDNGVGFCRARLPPRTLILPTKDHYIALTAKHLCCLRKKARTVFSSTLVSPDHRVLDCRYNDNWSQPECHQHTHSHNRQPS